VYYSPVDHFPYINYYYSSASSPDDWTRAARAVASSSGPSAGL